MANKASSQSQSEALAIANATKKPEQTKAQTKLVAAGIEKGIAVYKKQHKAKLREQDKQRKKSQRAQEQQKLANQEIDTDFTEEMSTSSKVNLLPWLLLLASWAGFAVYLTAFKS